MVDKQPPPNNGGCFIYGAACRSYANCPWMAMNELESLAAVFERDDNEIFVDPEVGKQAMVPLQRMLDFARR